MIFFTVFIAFILTWFFIEITLYISNKNNKDIINKKITYKKFIFILRSISITLFIFIVIYMYNFEYKFFKKTIEYCLGVIK